MKHEITVTLACRLEIMNQGWMHSTTGTAHKVYVRIFHTSRLTQMQVLTYTHKFGPYTHIHTYVHTYICTYIRVHQTYVVSATIHKVEKQPKSDETEVTCINNSSFTVPQVIAN